jgi:hypothetical protein
MFRELFEIWDFVYRQEGVEKTVFTNRGGDFGCSKKAGDITPANFLTDCG